MTREEFEKLVLDTYNVSADYPFDDDLETGVFRHTGTGKWFAIAMRITADKLGAEQGKMQTNVVNFKCAPEVIDSLAGIEPGIYRAYHMNKTHWLTASLSECDTDTISWLLGISYDLTRSKIKRK
ncbi:MAG: MmcQ/YjbR family DNA-binding protein [Clostridia bacterium]|nr:MmcQ/YjbR family DNA-binding protein [Clostridia bacterium]